MPVLLKEEKPSKKKGPPKCQIITVIFLILAACCIGTYIFYTKYIKKEICNTEECFRRSLSILASLDSSTNPCMDFYQFTCGNYSKRDLELGSISQYSYPELIFESQVDALITETNAGNEWKLLEDLKIFYRSCRDTSTIDSDKNDSFMSILNETVGWPMLQGPWNGTTFNLTTFLFSSHTLGIPFERFFRVSLNSELGLLQLVAPLDLEQFEDDTRTVIYQNLIIETVTNLGGLEYTAEIEAEKMMELEKSLKNVWDRYDSAHNEPLSTADLHQLFPKIDIPFLLKKVVGEYLELDDSNITAANSDVLSSLNMVLAGTPPRTLVNFVIWKFVVDQGYLLSSPLREKFEIFANLYKQYGYVDKITRRDVCLEEAKRRFPRVAEIAWLKTQLETKTFKLSPLLKNIKESLISRIQSTEYIAKHIKKQAIEHIKNKKNIIFSLYDYKLPELLNSVEVNSTTENVFQMARRLNNFKFKLRMQLINEYGETLEDYLDESLLSDIYFTDETLVLPALYVQPYFFSPTTPYYFNYAALGTEISRKLVKYLIEHLEGFEIISDGILSNTITWTNQDFIDLFLRSKCAADDYSTSDIGELTQEIFVENCQDLIAVDIAYEAYQNSVKKHADSNLPLLSQNPNQLFWINFGKQYCSEEGEELNGVPLKYRQLNVVKNSRYFGRDFGCAVGTEMHPEKKCIII